MKRAELGNNLQGIDYVYTAQGLLKTINHPTEANDPGKDGISNSFSTDVFGETLEYFSGDYTRGSTNITSLSTGGASDCSSNRIKKTDHIQNTTTYYVYDIAGNVLATMTMSAAAYSRRNCRFMQQAV